MEGKRWIGIALAAERSESEVHMARHASSRGDSRASKTDRAGAQPQPGFETQADPAETNHDHPSSPGSRKTVPGAGIVTPGRGIEDQQVPSGSARSPGARRLGTTRSGTSAVPSSGGAGAPALNSSPATESATDADSPPLGVRSNLRGPQGSDETLAPEIHDPNYTAASPRRRAGAARAGKTAPADIRSVPNDQPSDQRNTIRSVMSGSIECCEPATDLTVVARMMDEQNCGAIPVVDSTDSMKPVGVVTERDIVIRIVARNQNALEMSAGDCMSSGLLLVRPDDTLDDCLARMEHKQVRRALVVDQTGTLCGMVAQADIARRMPREQTGELVKDVSQPQA
jgi:CBS domain-containing protein